MSAHQNVSAIRLTRRQLMRGWAPVSHRAGRLPEGRAADAKFARRPLPWGGVNLAGAEFGNVPGRCSVDYAAYPAAEHVAYFSALGFNCFRVPFRWERLQPDLEKEFAVDEIRELTRLVEEITLRGHTVIPGPPQLCQAKHCSRRLGEGARYRLADGSYPNVRGLLAQAPAAFKANDRVVFGLMNEPYGLSAQAWWKSPIERWPPFAATVRAIW